MANHTPGPWRREPGDAAIYSQHGDLIAELGLNDQSANARLIVAAPEMYEALADCVLALGRAGANVADGPGRREWDAARAAIGKVLETEVSRG